MAALGATAAVQFEGLKELQRALRKVNKEANKDVRAKLREVGEPVRLRAEQLAVSEISHIGLRWSRMRIGVTVGAVYVAPKSRRRRGTGRPNLAILLLEKAMIPALDEKQQEAVGVLEDVLDRLGKQEGF